MNLQKMAQSVVDEFTLAGKTLVTAESLTAGLIASTVAEIPGASRVLLGGVVSYDPRIKHELLGVEQKIIDTVGVVSKPCARQMAEGARKRLSADIAVSATGLAGPGGGTEETPVGTVFIGVSSESGCRVRECHFSGSRQDIREASVNTALEIALEELYR